MSVATQNKLLDEAESVIGQAEKYLNKAGNQGEAALGEISARIKAAQRKLVDLEETAIAKTKAAATITDEYVHENPWRTIGVAAAVGLLVGVLIARK